MLDDIQQFRQLVEEKKNILITFKKNGDGDAIGSALALLLYLEKKHKNVDIVCHDFVLPKHFDFLTKSEQIKSVISDLQKFILSVEVKTAGVKELSYDLKDGILRIYITPKQGALHQDSVKTAQSDFKYDLIIVVNTPDLASLGALYENNTELFFKTPVINIDHESENERFGQLNLINLTASSTAEVVYEIFSQLGEESLDEKIATALLTGMIHATNSFKTENTKPHTLSVAGKLIDYGADRDFIIKNLYHTRSIATLKLWGTALSHLKINPEVNLVSTTLTRDDFIRAGAETIDLTDITHEIIANSPEAKNILILFEDTQNINLIHGILTVDKDFDALAITTEFEPNGNKKRATFSIENKKLLETQEEIIKLMNTVKK